MIDRDHPKLSVRDQAELLDVTRSSLYYRPRPPDSIVETLKREICTQYLVTPFYGARKMVIHLRRLGHEVGRKLVRRLMNVLGIKAIFPKPNLSKRRHDHKVYPYLLSGLTIDRPNHVWATDITYIPTPGGHVYLVAVLDWASRKVLSWRLSNTLSTHFCLEALDEAFARYGKPDIFNTDQGCQFTSENFIERLKGAGIAISMDGKGRCLDNIIVERFWRSLKYEMIFLHEFTTMADLRARIARYVAFYNNERPHQSHNYDTPSAVYAKAA
jgi:putative transposase